MTWQARNLTTAHFERQNSRKNNYSNGRATTCVANGGRANFAVLQNEKPVKKHGIKFFFWGVWGEMFPPEKSTAKLEKYAE